PSRVLFLPSRPPPTPPLFPYTTLFRSGDVVHAHAGAADEHRVVHVQLPTLGGVPDHGGAVAVSDDGVVRSATLVGGAQAVLEVPQVLGRVLGVVRVGGLAEVLWRVVADPGDRRGVAVAGLPSRFVEDRLASVEFPTDARQVGPGARNGGDHVVRGVGVAEGDDAPPVAFGGEVQQIGLGRSGVGVGGQPFVDGVHAAQRVVDPVQFAVLVLGAGVAEFLECVASGGQFGVLLGEADPVGPVPDLGGDAVHPTDHLAVGVDGRFLLHRRETVPPLFDVLR